MTPKTAPPNCCIASDLKAEPVPGSWVWSPTLGVWLEHKVDAFLVPLTKAERDAGLVLALPLTDDERMKRIFQ